MEIFDPPTGCKTPQIQTNINKYCCFLLFGTTTEEWRFKYDCDGVRVMEEYFLNGLRQHYRYFYAGGSYEVQIDDQVTTKEYYSIGGMMVAMRKLVEDGETVISDDLMYMASDHLTSASIMMDSSGTLLSEQRYMPFGKVRLDVGDTITVTDLGYTGQRNYGDFGLMDYNARFYSPRLGRFVQPDTIVPELGYPFAWDRYAYNINNPIRYIDPTGHGYCDTDHADPQLCEWTSADEAVVKKDVTEELGSYDDWKYKPDISWTKKITRKNGNRTTGSGFRVDASVQFGTVGIDFNFDIISVGGEDGTFIGVNPQFGEGYGASFSAGPLVIQNMDNIHDYAGHSSTAGFTAGFVFSLEHDTATASYGSNYTGANAPMVHYSGIGIGFEASYYTTPAISIEIPNPVDYCPVDVEIDQQLYFDMLNKLTLPYPEF